MCASAMAGSPSPTRVPHCGRTPRCRRGPASSCAVRRGYRPRRPYAHPDGACRLPVRPRARSGGEGGRRGPGRGWDRLLTDEYYRILQDPKRQQRGGGTSPPAASMPDWFGSNGRSCVQPMLQSNTAVGAANYGGYHIPLVDDLIDRAPLPRLPRTWWRHCGTRSAGRSSPTWRSCRSGLRADRRAPDHPCGYATRFPAARRPLVRRGQSVAGPTGLTRRYYSRN